MTVGTNLVVPVVLWGKRAPTHCISAVWMSPDNKNIVTACNDGQLCVWDLSENWEIYPRHMLFGHTAAITCIAPGSGQLESTYIVSASENGEMCLWDISDGRCVETAKLSYTHSSMQAYHFCATKDIRLVCNGYYPEILIIDPASFEILYTLSSRVTPDWISACCVLRPTKRDDDVIVAISNSGAVKVWALTGSESKNKPVQEDESKQIRCLNAQTLACCQFNQRTVLIVCSKYWQIYDAGDFTLLCSESNRCGERWAGGDFLSVDRVVVWSNEGKGYLYKLPTNCYNTEEGSVANTESESYHRAPSAPHAYYVLDFFSEQSLACAPAMILHTCTRGEHAMKKLLVRGDSEGQVVIWILPEVSERQMTLVRQESFDRLPALSPRCHTTLQDVWDNLYNSPSGILDGLCDEEKPAQVTSTVYIPSQGKLACGRSNGSIVIVPATQSIMLQVLDNKLLDANKVPTLVLEGHDGRVNCLLYPFNEAARYEPKHLVSGGADFSVCLWDIYDGSRLHTFTVHGGEVTQLLVPPNNCNPRILTSVCSVAADHSVTLLSLREKKCIMLAARHLFPVQCIRWRPLDDFMVVSCSDGTVYVWQMETGHLDRVVHGLTAEEILSNCDENAMPMDQLVNPNITLAQAFKRRNLATFKNLAQQKLQALSQNQQTSGAKLDLSRPHDYPMYIEGIRTNVRDPDAHVLFFDTEALIVQLLTEEFATMSPGELEAKGFSSLQPDRRRGSDSESSPTLAGIIAKVKDTADTVGQKIQAGVEFSSNQPNQLPNYGRSNSNQSSTQSPRLQRRLPEPLVLKNINLTMEIAQLFMSMLHAWGLDPDLDRLCINKLGLLKPKCPVSFGLISRAGHMSLMLPGWHKRVCSQETKVAEKVGSPRPQTLMQQARSFSIPEGEKSDSEVSEEQDTRQGTIQESEVKTQRVSSIIEEETKLFSMRARWLISSGITTQHLLSVISTANTLMSMNHATFKIPRRTRRIKSSSKNQPGVFGILSTEGDSSLEMSSDDDSAESWMLQQSQIKQGWSLLAALHCVLLPELVGHGNFISPLLEMLARRWQDRCLEIREAGQALLLAELRRIGPDGRKAVVDEWSPFLPTYVDPHLSILSTDTATSSNHDDEEDDDFEQVLAGDSPLHRYSRSFESRRKQATAIVMLAVIGAEFGHEIQPKRGLIDDSKKSKKAQEGFTLSNYSLARHTSKALTFLLQQPPSKKLPAHTPIRRAAIDLIGRGFTVWEPYLDVSAVLLGLLELCCGGERLVPSVTFGLPLSPAADACRTARHALSLIATARPATFIITMAKEVARYNTVAQNPQSQHSQPSNSVLIRSKSEILRVIELLVEKMPNDVADQIVEAMDIIIHCLDVSQLKSRGLQELFPAICRFSMVSSCGQTKRIWVGAKNGALACYEMKQHSKCQLIHAHSGPVIAVSVSPDGKFLVSYSHIEQKIKFWQTASSSLFGIGSQQTKCVRQIVTQPIQFSPHTNLLKLVRLVWTEQRVVVLLTVDGKEQKFYV